MEKEELFNNNKNLVHYTLNKLMGYTYSELSKKDKQDAVQEGLLLLWKACCKFDESRDCEFSTFGISTIKNGMKNFFNENIYNNGNLSKYNAQKKRSLEDKLNESPKDFSLDNEIELLYLQKISKVDSIKKEDVYKNDLSTDMSMFNDDLSNILTEKEINLMNYLKKGYKVETIADIYNVERTSVWRWKNSLEKKIKKYLYE